MLTESIPAADIPRPKRFLCRHIHTTGRRCRSVALRGESFCYYHHTTRHPPPPAGKYRFIDAAEPFSLPIVEDRASAILVTSLILGRIASNDLDISRAGRLLYGLQVIACLLPREPRPASVDRDSASNQEANSFSPSHPNHPYNTIEELVLDPVLGPLAPIAAMPEDKRWQHRPLSL